jgi:hypothetical protein
MIGNERIALKKDDVEQAAAELVIVDLRSRGHIVDLVGRPDRLNRTDKAVDFLVRVDGSEVGLEITDFYPSERHARRRGIGTKFARLLEAELFTMVQERSLGSVVVSLTLTHRPPTWRDLRSAVSETVRVILEQMPAVGFGKVVISDALYPLFVSVTIWRYPDRPERAEVLAQTGGGYVGASVASFLDGTLERKRDQTRAYDRVIVAAFDQSFVGDEETFANQLRELNHEIPSNWSAFYFVSPVGGDGWRARRVWDRRASLVPTKAGQNRST